MPCPRLSPTAARDCLVPPEDVPALSGALTQVLADRARGRAMGEAGHARLVADFSVERMVAATLTIYAELFARRASGMLVRREA